MDLRKLKKLIDLVQESGIAELEITEGEEKVKIVKGGAVSMMAAPAPAVAAPVEARPAPAAAPAAAAAEADAGQEGHVVKAPMVGTFYTSNAPDAPPFVSTGSVVHPDTIVCIIEAMKVFNQITADVNGTIIEILVKNGDPVEFGQPLFRVRLG